MLALCLASTGCASFSSEKKAAEAAAMELKKANFDALAKLVVNRSLDRGTPQEDIRSEFGDPDSTFQSGSATSQMEIWTYRRVEDLHHPDSWKQIRLYFENGHLTSYSY